MLGTVQLGSVVYKFLNFITGKLGFEPLIFFLDLGNKM